MGGGKNNVACARAWSSVPLGITRYNHAFARHFYSSRELNANGVSKSILTHVSLPGMLSALRRIDPTENHARSKHDGRNDGSSSRPTSSSAQWVDRQPATTPAANTSPRNLISV